MKPKLLYIGHSYHQKTKSTQFLIDYLNEFYDVEVKLEESWITGEQFDYSIINSNYKVIVFFQLLPDEESFKKLKHENMVHFPMFDYCKDWELSKWYPYKNMKIINFSKTLHNRLRKWGLKSSYIQYFIEPKEFQPGNKDEVFFWQRLEHINFNTLKKIFKKSDVKIHIHNAIDPGQTFIQPSEEDNEKFKITYSSWFETREEMHEFTKNKGIYIAPREYEGIGMSFLEAMAQGKAVIANNQPTMNEYIIDGVTGYLCDFTNPEPINLSQINQIQTNAYEYAEKGYKKWLVERKNIIDYIEEPYNPCKLTLLGKFLLFRSFFDRKKIIKIKFGKNPYLILFGKEIIKKTN